MKFAASTIDICSPFPTTQWGHITQTNELFIYHDPLRARILYLEEGDTRILHISADVLGMVQKIRDRLQAEARQYFQDPALHLITSATHTHYANSLKNERYAEYFFQTLLSGIRHLDIREYQNVRTAYKTVFFDGVGKSRISGYESGKEYLTLIRIFHGERTLVNLLIHNCHPTILEANVPYFSAEYPGYVLDKLQTAHPEAYFTYLQGASGDISTRFTRPGQDYESVRLLGDRLLIKIEELLQEKLPSAPFSLHYTEQLLHYEHTFAPIDLGNVRQNLSEREKLTIHYGEIVRRQMEESQDVIHDALWASLEIGEFRIIFCPNEIFSDYLNCLNLENSMLVSYSNGYGPYILPVDFPYLTYETFTDTLTRETKEKIKFYLTSGFGNDKI